MKEHSTEDVMTSPTTARERLAALTDAPSAAEFFQISNEQPPAQDQAQSQAKSTNERQGVPTTTDASYTSIGIMDDEDLTESDVEFADGSSDDFFDEDDLFDDCDNDDGDGDDDDGESAQPGSIVESPPPSEFDDGEEESQTGGNGGMKLVENIPYPEVLQPCEVSAEDEARVLPTEEEPDESSSLRSPLVDAIYSPNPISFKQTFTAKLSHPTSDARAPSPSDAAMAKVTTAQLPRMESAVQMQSSFIAQMTSDFPRLSSTESPYARSTWSTWPEFTADLPSECAAPVYGQFNPSFLYQEGPFAYRQPGEPINADGSASRGEEENNAPQEGTFTKPDQPLDSTRISTPPPTHATAPDVEQHVNVLPPVGLRATRLSIYDIVEKNTQDASIQNNPQKLKRKADDLSTSGDALAMDLACSDPLISELGLTPQAAETPQPTKPQTATPPPPTTDPDAAVTTPTPEAVEQPARKRAKTGVAKYAAAVFAGVVAGGVGTMAALLALPPI
jgi:hypothetical protein